MGQKWKSSLTQIFWTRLRLIANVLVQKPSLIYHSGVVNACITQSISFFVRPFIIRKPINFVSVLPIRIVPESIEHLYNSVPLYRYVPSTTSRN